MHVSNTLAICLPDPAMMIEVDILWDLSVGHWKDQLNMQDDQILEAVRAAGQSRGFQRGHIGVRITDDESIHRINVAHLSHDYPTDVISFPYQCDDQGVIGELVASVETAEKNAREFGSDTRTELLLYIVHGVLHITGMDDHDAAEKASMRLAEREVFDMLGVALEHGNSELRKCSNRGSEA